MLRLLSGPRRFRLRVPNTLRLKSGDGTYTLAETALGTNAWVRSGDT
jgi:hypothetical protein